MTRSRRLLQYLKPYRLHLGGAAVFAMLVSLMTAAQAYLVKPVLDDIFIQKNTVMLTLIPLAIIAVSLFKAVANYVRAYLMRYVGNRIIQGIRDQLYGHLLLMPLGFYTKQTTGRLMSRVINDVGLVQSVISNVIKDLFQQAVTMAFLICVLFYQNSSLALIAVLVLPFSYYPITRASRRLRKISKAGQEKMADLTSFLQETFSGIRIVKAFGAEGYEAQKFKEKNKDYFRNTMKATRIAEMTPSLMEVLGAIGAALIIWVGGYQVVQGSMTPGAFLSFLAACWLMYAPIRHISTANNAIQQSLAAVDRVFELLDQKTERDLEKGGREIPPIQKEIEFRRITFQYEESEEPALKEVNLTVKAGEVVALVGSSGAGKTTLVNLIPRFFEPSEGAILIDGVDIREVRLTSLRRQIGIVSQETMLFDDTVAHNIAYGMKEVAMEAIIKAAEAAYAHLFILQMPQGYQTLIGERGIRLSGGERQRLAIARALLKNPPILILDEATSNLDTASEQMIQKALSHLLKDRTTFVIAHRLSTIKNASQIVVIEQGRIREVGRHEDLLQRSGAYKRLYEMQFKEPREELRVES